MEDDDYYGDSCYFHRDLKVGYYGGDVSCLQQYLRHEGFLNEEASGYFGSATEEAVSKWQVSNNLLPAKGILGYSSRVAYARHHRIPTAEQLRAMEHRAEGHALKCIDIACSTRVVSELCHTSASRCLTQNATYEDRMHLCQEACQMAMTEACDKAFPSNQSSSFKDCLSMVAKNCRQNCDRTINR